MPKSHEKDSDPVTELPNPDLNPLLNPTLGRNLGRWAQVYFTSPPEKREEAVGELLRELQGEPQSAPAVTEPALKLAATEVLDKASEIQCAECGHRHTNPQRFCGMCGAAMTGDKRDEPPLRILPEPLDEPEPTRRPALPSFELASVPDRPNENFSDIRWLREKNLSAGMSSWRMGPRYTPAVVVVFAIGILFYAQWRLQGTPTQPAAKPAAQKSAPPSPAPQETAAAKQSTSGDSIPQTAPAAKAPVPLENDPEIPAQNAAAQKEPVPATPLPQAIADNLPAPEATGSSTPDPPTAGATELAQAEDFLNGKKYPRDSAIAAKYLWKAVGKENPSAILLLSDMYLAGDGVPKSCDQARLLLTAAARKGVPQAADKLRNLLRSGCR